jgi:hypothetical protein
LDELTFDEWLEIFNPEENLLDEAAKFGGIMFSPEGDERKYICEAHPKRIWTYHLDAKGNKNLVRGFIGEGALGYFLCEKNETNRVLVIRDVSDREALG